MKHMLIPAAAAAIAAASLNVPASAGDVQGDAYNCKELYVMRNQLYRDAGYCFKTPKAIKQFGNAGCQYDSLSDVPLSANQRSTISAIKKSEARQGC